MHALDWLPYSIDMLRSVGDLCTFYYFAGYRPGHEGLGGPDEVAVDGRASVEHLGEDGFLNVARELPLVQVELFGELRVLDDETGLLLERAGCLHQVRQMGPHEASHLQKDTENMS